MIAAAPSVPAAFAFAQATDGVHVQFGDDVAAPDTLVADEDRSFRLSFRTGRQQLADQAFRGPRARAGMVFAGFEAQMYVGQCVQVFEDTKPVRKARDVRHIPDYPLLTTYRDAAVTIRSQLLTREAGRSILMWSVRPKMVYHPAHRLRPVRTRRNDPFRARAAQRYRMAVGHYLARLVAQPHPLAASAHTRRPPVHAVVGFGCTRFDAIQHDDI